MLHPFVSVPTARRNAAPELTFSASVHVGLLCAALTSTGVVRRPHLPATVAEQVRFATLPFRGATNPALRSADRAPHGRRVEAALVFTLPQLLLSFELPLPELVSLPDYQPDMAAAEIGESGRGVLADDVLQLGLVSPTSRRQAGAPYGTYDEGAVEKRAMPVPANSKPPYPRRMLSRGIETHFSVYFVVDTSGSVDRATVELPRSVEQEFANAVSEALSTWRFVPAEVGGRRVRQRVVQPFSFRIERQFSSRGGP
jgi:TonB family protein